MTEEKEENKIKSLNTKDIYEFFRLKLSVSQALPFFVGAILSDKTIIFQPFKLLKTSIAFLPVLLVSISGSLLNDYSDFDQDLKNPKKAEKPLITGKIDKETALKFAIMFVILSFIISLMFKNIRYFILVLCGIGLSIGYYFLKEKVPFDLLIDAFLLPLPILSGWYFIRKDTFPISLLSALIILCINIYLHGALWDYNIDEISTVKVIGKKASLFTLIITTILFYIVLPKNMMISKIAMILLNLLFIYFLENKKWDCYTNSLVCFGVVFFINVIIHF